MTTDKTTPGEWKAAIQPTENGLSWTVHNSRGQRVCDIEDRGPDETEANAKLIASAKQMRDMLQETFAALEHVYGNTLTYKELRNDAKSLLTHLQQ